MPEATEATMMIGKLLGRFNVPAFADPNLQIRPGHPDSKIRCMGRSKKKFSSPPRSGHSLVPRAPPLDLPLTCKYIWMQPS